MSKFFICIILAFFMVACHVEEDHRLQVSNDIAGTWEVETWTIDGSDQFKWYDSLSIAFIPLAHLGGHSIWTTKVSQDHTSFLFEVYEIVDNGNSILLNGDLFRESTLSVKIQNNILTMNGLLGTHSWYYVARRN